MFRQPTSADGHLRPPGQYPSLPSRDAVAASKRYGSPGGNPGRASNDGGRRMRAVIRVCIALAVCLYAFGWPAPGFAQVAAFPEESDLLPADVAPFQSRLQRTAEECRVKPVASGHVFGRRDRETFLFRLGEGSDCAKQGNLRLRPVSECAGRLPYCGVLRNGTLCNRPP